MSDDKTLTIGLKNYPNIRKYLEETKGDTLPLVKHLQLLDTIFENGDHIKAEKVLGMSINDILRETYEAHFDYRGITKNSDNYVEAELLAVLELENNPLSVLTGGKQTRDLEGNEISLENFTGMPYVNFKRHLQKFLYSMKYLNHKDYVNYLMLGKHDLMQVDRNKHIEQIIQIKPALSYQRKQGLPVGFFLDGTGFFDCGEMDLSKLEYCPACSMGARWHLIEDVGYCLECKAAVKHRR